MKFLVITYVYYADILNKACFIKIMTYEIKGIKCKTSFISN
ncbi:hypothetical protein VCRA2120E126_100058 [Vibrio crassostreae]|nr:hypothetical protein VCRA2120E126_100058 [Vibrio crassostreae]